MKNYQEKKPGTQMSPWQSLANAIVLSAVKDYRKVLRRLRRNPHNQAAQDEARDLERFFRSEWYGILTNVPGEMLIRKLKEE